MSYKELKRQLAEKELPIVASNQDNEQVVIEQGHDEDGRHFYRLTTSQNNGWLRVNTLYEDGSTDEAYMK